MQIVVRQISGLGNQLFQYAAGRYYAKRHQASLRLAIDPPHRASSGGHPRPFLLSHFAIEVPTPELTRVERLILAQRRGLATVAALHNRLRGIRVFTEPIDRRYSFIPEIPPDRLARTVYLAGYWQTRQMVDAVEDELRRELQLREAATGRNLEVLQQIQNTADPISLHVRRGDYTMAAEGRIALPMSYYTQAIEAIRQRVANPTFFVFSDDMAFCRANLSLGPQTVFIDHNDETAPHEDLRLMSACRHHIIANSTLSWWGAWLNPRKDKMVVAPKYWHLRRESFYPGLLPPDWTTIAIEPL